MNTRFKHSLFYKFTCTFVAIVFVFTSVVPPQMASAQVMPTILNLPTPGTMVPPSPGFTPAMVVGVTVHPENPLEFDFIVDKGDADLDSQQLENESAKLIKYFLATLTVPEDEIWVNLSPYEKDRMIPTKFGETEMGRDLLAQDYLLKQLTASLMYPEDELGKKFWDRVYKQAYEQYGTTEIPMNTFNKVWIVPENATVYEHEGSAYVLTSHLKVMLEEDYMAREALSVKREANEKSQDTKITSQIIKKILIPEIEQEINTGETFANLRQIYNSMILATWYKKTLRDSLLGQIYMDQNKIKGVDVKDKTIKQKIYDQYLTAFEKGVYNYIKEDLDPASNELIPRKYFSGGTRGYRGDEIASNSIENIPSFDLDQMIGFVKARQEEDMSQAEFDRFLEHLNDFSQRERAQILSRLSDSTEDDPTQAKIAVTLVENPSNIYDIQEFTRQLRMASSPVSGVMLGVTLRDKLIDTISQREDIGEAYRVDWNHGKLHAKHLWDHAIEIAQEEGIKSQVDWEVMAAAIVFHDIFADVDQENHPAMAAADVKDVLPQFGFDQRRISKVQTAIILGDQKDPRGAQARTKAGLEALLMYDIDNLDPLGTKGIWRYIDVYLERGNPLEEIRTNAQKRLSNLHFDATKRRAKNGFKILNDAFVQLEQEDHPDRHPFGWTGVVNYIRTFRTENRNPLFIAQKAITTLKSLAGITPEDQSDYSITLKYFQELEKIYATDQTMSEGKDQSISSPVSYVFGEDGTAVLHYSLSFPYIPISHLPQFFATLSDVSNEEVKLTESGKKVLKGLGAFIQQTDGKFKDLSLKDAERFMQESKAIVQIGRWKYRLADSEGGIEILDQNGQPLEQISDPDFRKLIAIQFHPALLTAIIKMANFSEDRAGEIQNMTSTPPIHMVHIFGEQQLIIDFGDGQGTYIDRRDGTVYDPTTAPNSPMYPVIAEQNHLFVRLAWAIANSYIRHHDSPIRSLPSLSTVLTTMPGHTPPEASREDPISSPVLVEASLSQTDRFLMRIKEAEMMLPKLDEIETRFKAAEKIMHGLQDQYNDVSKAVLKRAGKKIGEPIHIGYDSQVRRLNEARWNIHDAVIGVSTYDQKRFKKFRTRLMEDFDEVKFQIGQAKILYADDANRYKLDLIYSNLYNALKFVEKALINQTPASRATGEKYLKQAAEALEDDPRLQIWNDVNKVNSRIDSFRKRLYQAHDDPSSGLSDLSNEMHDYYGRFEDLKLRSIHYYAYYLMDAREMNRSDPLGPIPDWWLDEFRGQVDKIVLQVLKDSSAEIPLNIALNAANLVKENPQRYTSVTVLRAILSTLMAEMYEAKYELAAQRNIKRNKAIVKATKRASDIILKTIKNLDYIPISEGASSSVEPGQGGPIVLPASFGRQIRPGRFIVRDDIVRMINFLDIKGDEIRERIARLQRGPNWENQIAAIVDEISQDAQVEGNERYLKPLTIPKEDFLIEWYMATMLDVTMDQFKQFYKPGHIIVPQQAFEQEYPQELLNIWTHEEHHKLWLAWEEAQPGEAAAMKQLYEDLLTFADQITSGKGKKLITKTYKVKGKTLKEILMRGMPEYKDLRAEEFWIHAVDRRGVHEAMAAGRISQNPYFTQFVFSAIFEQAEVLDDPIKDRLVNAINILRGQNDAAYEEAKKDKKASFFGSVEDGGASSPADEKMLPNFELSHTFYIGDRPDDLAIYRNFGIWYITILFGIFNKFESPYEALNHLENLINEIEVDKLGGIIDTPIEPATPILPDISGFSVFDLDTREKRRKALSYVIFGKILSETDFKKQFENLTVEQKTDLLNFTQVVTTFTELAREKNVLSVNELLVAYRAFKEEIIKLGKNALTIFDFDIDFGEDFIIEIESDRDIDLISRTLHIFEGNISFSGPKEGESLSSPVQTPKDPGFRERPAESEPELSRRASNVLIQLGIDKFEDLAQFTERDIIKLKNSGPVTLNEIKSIMAERGLSFKPSSLVPPISSPVEGKTGSVKSMNQIRESDILVHRDHGIVEVVARSNIEINVQFFGADDNRYQRKRYHELTVKEGLLRFATSQETADYRQKVMDYATKKKRLKIPQETLTHPVEPLLHEIKDPEKFEVQKQQEAGREAPLQDHDSQREDNVLRIQKNIAQADMFSLLGELDVVRLTAYFPEQVREGYRTGWLHIQSAGNPENERPIAKLRVSHDHVQVEQVSLPGQNKEHFQKFITNKIKGVVLPRLTDQVSYDFIGIDGQPASSPSPVPENESSKPRRKRKSRPAPSPTKKLGALSEDLDDAFYEKLESNIQIAKDEPIRLLVDTWTQTELKEEGFSNREVERLRLAVSRHGYRLYRNPELKRKGSSSPIAPNKFFKSSQGVIQRLEDTYEQMGKDMTDENIRPIVARDDDGNPIGMIENGDIVFMINHRDDRAFPTFEVFTDPNFNAKGNRFDPKPGLNVKVVPLNNYNQQLLKERGVQAAFEEDELGYTTISDIMVDAGVIQGRFAETNKKKHVLFFFNGRRNFTPQEYKDKHIYVDGIVRSEGKTDNKKDPKMKYAEVADNVIEFLDKHKDSEDPVFTLVNFATDIQGHVLFGERKRAQTTVELTDKALGRIRDKVAALGGVLIVTADHGNVEEMMVLDDNGIPRRDKYGFIPSTQHSRNNPVPFIVEGLEGAEFKEGEFGLANVGPTVLDIMGLDPAQGMDESLLKKFKRKGIKGPVVLLVRDGWGDRVGVNDNPKAAKWDATVFSDTPVDDDLRAKNPWIRLKAHGDAVGLPDIQMGDSDNGHTTMGAGKIVPTVFGKIMRQIESGEFYDNPVLTKSIKEGITNGNDFVITGLLSDGGVHSHENYALALMEKAARMGIKGSQSVIKFHVELDGRDVMTRIKEQRGSYYLQRMLDKAKALGIEDHIIIGSVGGRAFGMDRDGIQGEGQDENPEVARQIWNERFGISYKAKVYGIDDRAAASPVKDEGKLITDIKKVSVGTMLVHQEYGLGKVVEKPTIDIVRMQYANGQIREHNTVSFATFQSFRTPTSEEHKTERERAMQGGFSEKIAKQKALTDEERDQLFAIINRNEALGPLHRMYEGIVLKDQLTRELEIMARHNRQIPDAQFDKDYFLEEGHFLSQLLDWRKEGLVNVLTANVFEYTLLNDIVQLYYNLDHAGETKVSMQPSKVEWLGQFWEDKDTIQYLRGLVDGGKTTQAGEIILAKAIERRQEMLEGLPAKERDQVIQQTQKNLIVILEDLFYMHDHSDTYRREARAAKRFLRKVTKKKEQQSSSSVDPGPLQDIPERNDPYKLANPGIIGVIQTKFYAILDQQTSVPKARRNEIKEAFRKIVNSYTLAPLSVLGEAMERLVRYTEQTLIQAGASVSDQKLTNLMLGVLTNLIKVRAELDPDNKPGIVMSWSGVNETMSPEGRLRQFEYTDPRGIRGSIFISTRKRFMGTEHAAGQPFISLIDDHEEDLVNRLLAANSIVDFLYKAGQRDPTLLQSEIFRDPQLSDEGVFLFYYVLAWTIAKHSDIGLMATFDPGRTQDLQNLTIRINNGIIQPTMASIEHIRTLAQYQFQPVPDYVINFLITAGDFSLRGLSVPDQMNQEASAVIGLIYFSLDAENRQKFRQAFPDSLLQRLDAMRPPGTNIIIDTASSPVKPSQGITRSSYMETLALKPMTRSQMGKHYNMYSFTLIATILDTMTSDEMLTHKPVLKRTVDDLRAKLHQNGFRLASYTDKGKVASLRLGYPLHKKLNNQLGVAVWRDLDRLTRFSEKQLREKGFTNEEITAIKDALTAHTKRKLKDEGASSPTRFSKRGWELEVPQAFEDQFLGIIKLMNDHLVNHLEIDVSYIGWVDEGAQFRVSIHRDFPQRENTQAEFTISMDKPNKFMEVLDYIRRMYLHILDTAYKETTVKGEPSDFFIEAMEMDDFRHDFITAITDELNQRLRHKKPGLINRLSITIGPNTIGSPGELTRGGRFSIFVDVYGRLNPGIPLEHFNFWLPIKEDASVKSVADDIATVLLSDLSPLTTGGIGGRVKDGLREFRKGQGLGSSPVGGIDLNPELLDLQIKRDANWVPLPLDQQPIHQMNIEGFLPVIINVTPLATTPLLLGLLDKEIPTDRADTQTGVFDLGYVDKYRNKYLRGIENVSFPRKRESIKN